MRTVNTILPYAQLILYTLLELMPSPHQRLSLQASFALFMEPANGKMLPEYSVIKSPAALSRFFNEYGWPTRAVIRATRQHILKQLNNYTAIGQRPYLQVIIDLTTLEKRGKFKAFATLLHILKVKLSGLEGVVTVSWFYLKRDGKLEKRFVISTRALKGSTIAWWGSRRWAIEGFFKTAKYRFGLSCFGQQTLLGVYRWLILSFISFVLTHWVYLSSNPANPPEWKKESELALQQLMPHTAVSLLLVEIERQREFLLSQGLAFELVLLKI